jgi:hypothetical protein
MILISYKHFLSLNILCRKSKISTLSKPPLNPAKEAITDQSNYQSHRLHFSGKQYHEKIHLNLPNHNTEIFCQNIAECFDNVVY